MAMRMTETELEQYHDVADEERVQEESGLTRIRQLERLNATLAAEIDRMRPVVTAVHDYCESDQHGWDNPATLQVVRDAYRAYEAAKEGGDGLSPKG